MLNSGEKKFTLCATKKNIPTLVLSEKKFLNETKNHNNPPFQVKWSVPKHFVNRSNMFEGSIKYCMRIG